MRDPPRRRRLGLWRGASREVARLTYEALPRPPACRFDTPQPPLFNFRCGNSQHPSDDLARGEALIKQVYEATRLGARAPGAGERFSFRAHVWLGVSTSTGTCAENES